LTNELVALQEAMTSLDPLNPAARIVARAIVECEGKLTAHAIARVSSQSYFDGGRQPAFDGRGLC
jgi:hypothetical protein